MDATPSFPRRGTRPSGARSLLARLRSLLCFFVVNKLWGIPAATAVLIALPLALFLVWAPSGASPGVLVGKGRLVFGLLTLILRDETFIKLKVTAINLILGGVLGVGPARACAPEVDVRESFRLSDEGWRVDPALHLLLLPAGLNEVLRRVLSTDAWVNFGSRVLGSTLLFTLQAPLPRSTDRGAPG
jgi:intracellular septation protein